jgi:hypothetical protein
MCVGCARARAGPRGTRESTLFLPGGGAVRQSLEAYAQQVGRAGRDGLPAKCLLFCEPKNLQLLSFLKVCALVQLWVRVYFRAASTPGADYR